jgi:5-methylcytosine-specific restriction protein A
MGMRRTLKTGTLILVSNHTTPIYVERWDDKGIFHYTGMGLEGDQDLDFAQNKTLAQFRQNGLEVYLFEVFRKGLYTFVGRVESAGEPYQEVQADSGIEIRWISVSRHETTVISWVAE